MCIVIPAGAVSLFTAAQNTSSRLRSRDVPPGKEQEALGHSVVRHVLGRDDVRLNALVSGLPPNASAPQNRMRRYYCNPIHLLKKIESHAHQRSPGRGYMDRRSNSAHPNRKRPSNFLQPRTGTLNKAARTSATALPIPASEACQQTSNAQTRTSSPISPAPVLPQKHPK
jgi:hypothetical protein